MGQAAEALQQLGRATARVLRDGRPVTIAGRRGRARRRAAAGPRRPRRRRRPPARVGRPGGGRGRADRRIAAGRQGAGRAGDAGPHRAGRQRRGGRHGPGRGGRRRARTRAWARPPPRWTSTNPRTARSAHGWAGCCAWPCRWRPWAAGCSSSAPACLRGQPLAAMLSLGVTTAISAIPEGLPLLAGVGQAGVARRLARRKALVRRLAAVEALGRVDVACTDKTGTLTEGRLAVHAGGRPRPRDAALPGELRRRPAPRPAAPPPWPARTPTRRTPPPTRPTWPCLRGRAKPALDDELRAPRQGEAPFDPARAFHAAVVSGRLCVKGAPEVRGRRAARTGAAPTATSRWTTPGGATCWPGAAVGWPRRGAARSCIGRREGAGPTAPPAADGPAGPDGAGLRRHQRPAAPDGARGGAALPGGRRPRHHADRRPPRHRPRHRPRGRPARRARTGRTAGPDRRRPGRAAQRRPGPAAGAARR